MVVSLSLVLLLGVFVYLIWRYARLPVWQIVLCALFGFYLASSSVGPNIAHVVQAFAHFLSRLHL
jgi:hypothetical protein